MGGSGRSRELRNSTPLHRNRQQVQADHSHPTTEALFLIHQRGARELYQLTTGAAPALPWTSLKELAGKRKGHQMSVQVRGYRR